VQLPERLAQGWNAGESDQFGLDRVGGALAFPHAPKGVRIGQVEPSRLGHQKGAPQLLP